MRVQRERAAKPCLCSGRVAEAPLDRGAVEELQGVLRAEPKRVTRPGKRLAAAAVPREGPRKDVVAVDGRASCVGGPSEGERFREPDAVVDVEQRRLEVSPNAVCVQQALDRADQGVLAARGAVP